MKRYILLLMIIGLIGLVSGLDSLGEYQQGNCVKVRQVCPTCSYVNFSVIMPNSSLLINNAQMLDQGGGVWGFDVCNATTTGRYDVLGDGNLNGDQTPFATYFYITSQGEQVDNSLTETSVFLLIAVAVAILIFFKVSKFVGSLSIFLIGFGILFRTPHQGWIGWIVIISGFSMLIYALMGGGSKVRRIRRR